MERGSLNAQKHTSGETPRCVRCSVFGVRCALLPAHRLCSRPPLLAPAAARSLAPVAAGAEPAARGTRGVLVDASVYLKPTKLVNVALDMLARLAPCLNLGVGELGHKDLLDTIGADNCRK